MRIDTDGRLWAINPETGFFGVAPGTNSKTNPSMMKTIARNTIYTNVVLAKDDTVWWEGGDGEPPAEAVDWQGRPWTPGPKDDKGNPHSRRAPQQPLHGAAAPVPVAFVPHRAPPWRADLGDHLRRSPGPPGPAGVPSLRLGARGVRRGHDGLGADGRPVSASRARSGAIRWPCCRSAATTWADYFRALAGDGQADDATRPRSSMSTGSARTRKASFLWPGFGENLRVIEWILDRCRGEGDATKTPIGYVPTPDSLDLTGLEIPPEDLVKCWRSIATTGIARRNASPRSSSSSAIDCRRRCGINWRPCGCGCGLRFR